MVFQVKKSKKIKKFVIRLKWKCSWKVMLTKGIVIAKIKDKNKKFKNNKLKTNSSKCICKKITTCKTSIL